MAASEKWLMLDVISKDADEPKRFTKPFVTLSAVPNAIDELLIVCQTEEEAEFFIWTESEGPVLLVDIGLSGRIVSGSVNQDKSLLVYVECDADQLTCTRVNVATGAMHEIAFGPSTPGASIHELAHANVHFLCAPEHESSEDVLLLAQIGVPSKGLEPYVTHDFCLFGAYASRLQTQPLWYSVNPRLGKIYLLEVDLADPTRPLKFRSVVCHSGFPQQEFAVQLEDTCGILQGEHGPARMTCHEKEPISSNFLCDYNIEVVEGENDAVCLCIQHLGTLTYEVHAMAWNTTLTGTFTAVSSGHEAAADPSCKVHFLWLGDHLLCFAPGYGVHLLDYGNTHQPLPGFQVNWQHVQCEGDLAINLAHCIMVEWNQSLSHSDTLWVRVRDTTTLRKIEVSIHVDSLVQVALRPTTPGYTRTAIAHALICHLGAGTALLRGLERICKTNVDLLSRSMIHEYLLGSAFVLFQQEHSSEARGLHHVSSIPVTASTAWVTVFKDAFSVKAQPHFCPPWDSLQPPETATPMKLAEASGSSSLRPRVSLGSFTPRLNDTGASTYFTPRYFTPAGEAVSTQASSSLGENEQPEGGQLRTCISESATQLMFAIRQHLQSEADEFAVCERIFYVLSEANCLFPAAFSRRLATLAFKTLPFPQFVERVHAGVVDISESLLRTDILPSSKHTDEMKHWCCSQCSTPISDALYPPLSKMRAARSAQSTELLSQWRSPNVFRSLVRRELSLRAEQESCQFEVQPSLYLLPSLSLKSWTDAMLQREALSRTQDQSYSKADREQYRQEFVAVVEKHGTSDIASKLLASPRSTPRY
eukprot:m.12064 g.12064  ORF g.12064 m.12064 type:complete len:817 (-) comp5800_c0_seq2:188-2638(-)